MELIDWVKSEGGQYVPRQEGNLICSKVNPVEEARRWVQSITSDITKDDGIAVMGLGGGFHIRILSEKFPSAKILVFERHSSIVDRLGHEESKHVAVENLRIVGDPSFDALAEDNWISNFVRAPFVVVRHPTSFRLNRAYYKKIEGSLTGRGTQESLVEFLKLRPDLANLVAKVSKNEEPLSILSIAEVLRNKRKPLDASGLSWMLLRELVK
jgi:hypothetical protein